jgi:hypothetical protein
MEKIKEIKSAIKQIDKEISTLEKQKSKLEKQLINQAKSPIEKFKIWWESNADTDEEDYLPDRSEFPKLREYMDELGHDWYRYQSTDISDFMDEAFAFAFYGEKNEYWEWKEEDKIKFQEIGYEIMKGKLKSFKYDW